MSGAFSLHFSDAFKQLYAAGISSGSQHGVVSYDFVTNIFKQFS